MKFTVTVGPTLDPISLAEAKAHCRVDDTESDGLLVGYILAARQYVESICGIALMTQTIEAYFNSFYECLMLPRWPVQSVSSIAYLDNLGATQTTTPSIYYSNVRGRPAFVARADSQSWPDTYLQLNAVTVTFVAGYGSTPSDIPEPIRQAMLLLISYWFENRETVNIGNITSELPMTTMALLAPYRVYY